MRALGCISADGRKGGKLVLADRRPVGHHRARWNPSPSPAEWRSWCIPASRAWTSRARWRSSRAPTRRSRTATRREGRPPAPGYEVTLVGRDGARRAPPAASRSCPSCGLEDVPAPLDTLIVPGGSGHRRAEDDEELVRLDRAHRRHAPGGRSRCAPAPSCWPARGCSTGAAPPPTGPRRRSSPTPTPRSTVDPDPIYIRDGAIWTSAGVTAGMDLALALVEEDHDRELALTIARHLVLFLRRPGSQSQFSATLSSQEPEREPLREIQRSVIEDPAGEHTVEAMASRAHMSPRHFARAFRAETGVTPARYVERVRLEAARRLLEDTTRVDLGGGRGRRVPERRDDAPRVRAGTRRLSRGVQAPLPRRPTAGEGPQGVRAAAQRRRQKGRSTWTSRSCCTTGSRRSTRSGRMRS